MTHAFRWRAARLMLAPAMLTATLAWAAPEVSAQNTQTTQTQTQTQTTNQNKPTQQTTARPATQTQTRSQTQTSKPPASQAQTPAQTPATSQTTKTSQTTGTQAAQTQTTSAPADEPLYSEFKGVRIGTSQIEARKRLGNPEVKSKEMDIFSFSDKQRARVAYDANGNAVAVVVTYIGKNADAPAPKSILGTDADSKPDGSLYKMLRFPKAGYWVSYTRTPGDDPMTVIAIQKIQ
jgi:cytoskeletal protein RodZ